MPESITRSCLYLCPLLFSLFVALHGPTLAVEHGQLQMFLDGDQIASAKGVEFVVQQPQRREQPVISGHLPWQANPYMFGTVLFDEGEQIYKAWYESYNFGRPVEQRAVVLYATSRDGIEWEFPDLGLVSFDGSTANNILFAGLGYGDLYSPSVIKDDAETDPARRYKMVYWDKNGPESYGDGGMFTAVSADGIHWTRTANAILPTQKNAHSISDVMDLMRDQASGDYVVYAKGWADPFPSHRQVVMARSSDFLQWSVPEPIVQHAHDPSDPQSYGMPVFAYEGVYIGLMRSYKKPGDETMDIQLTVSRDGKNWTRVADSQTFLPLGAAGTWDGGMIFSAPPIVRGDRIEIFYGGWDGAHNQKRRNAAIGLATLPIGRFVAATAADGRIATLSTRPFQWSGRQIQLNVDADRGTVRAALFDSDGNVYAGFDFDACEAIDSNGFRKRLRWRDQKDLTALQGKAVSLQFQIRGDAKLFGYRVTDR